MAAISAPVISVMDDEASNMEANAYVDEADFITYHSNLQNDLSAYSDEEILSAIIRGSTYLDHRFTYVGYRLIPYQPMEWPRQNAWDNRRNIILGVPPQVIQATCEYAWRSLTQASGSASLVADPQRDATGKEVQRRIQAISGAVKEEVVFDRYVSFRMPTYPEADLILTSRGLVYQPNAGGIMASRTARA